MAKMTGPELIAFLEHVFPQSRPERYEVETVEEGRVVFRCRAGEEDLRPGATVSGPPLMAISDLGMYLAVLSAIGPVALAVTTSLNINFLRKPGAGDLVVETVVVTVG